MLAAVPAARQCGSVDSQNWRGRGVLLAKMDINSAYHMVPGHPEDQPLEGIQWKGETFFDTQPPFGLRSVTNLFSAVANILQWSFQCTMLTWVAHCLL